MPPPRSNPRSSSSGSSSSLPINNPSYAANPHMWHAIAMQQQRISEMKLSLGGPRSLRQPPQQPPRPPSSSQSSRPDYNDDDDDDDSKNARPVTLTLAQRMGLAEAPEPELTPSEWEHIAAVSRDRGASREPCVICCEHFRDEKQVLLSCGHVFHRACLRSWERHSKSKVCPVCRKQHYRKRGTDEGANLYREECAIRLQAWWRGAVTRRETDKALRHLNPTRMRRYCESRLSGLTDELLGRIEAERSAVDELFAEIDSTVAASRVLLGDGNNIDWEAAASVAHNREGGLGDCPVCLHALNNGTGEKLALLSCTHVFHARCLSSFERFSIGTSACLCPVCRAAYTKQTVDASLRCEPCDGGELEVAAADAAVSGICEGCCNGCGGAASFSSSATRRLPAACSSSGSCSSATSTTQRRTAAAAAPGARAGVGRGGPRVSGVQASMDRLMAVGNANAELAGRGRGRGAGLHALRRPL